MKGMKGLQELKVDLPGYGREFFLKGPQGIGFKISGLRSAPSELKILLKYLPTSVDRIVFPYTGNIPALPACASVLNPDSKVTVFEIDSHDYNSMKNRLEEFSNIDFQLGSDLQAADEESQLGIFSVGRNTDRLLSFDILERMNKCLPDGSPVLVLISKIRQKDFMKKLQKDFSKGQIIDSTREEVLYRAFTKKKRGERWTPRLTSFEVDAIGAKMAMITRPGVFSHGRVDTGGLALYECTEMTPGDKLLELGCGAGLVSLLTAQRMKQEEGEFKGKILMVDSCSRAIECAALNIEALGFENVECLQEDNFKSGEKFDVVTGNPPYYANHRIAEYFIHTAAKVLKKRGRLYLVSKHGDVMEEIAEEAGFSCETVHRRNYEVLVATLN